MRGTMLWFNREKDLGVIEGPDGQRFDVHGIDFSGARPEVRCRGTAVQFDVVGSDARATAVSVLPEVAPRRARRRSGGRVSA